MIIGNRSLSRGQVYTFILTISAVIVIVMAGFFTRSLLLLNISLRDFHKTLALQISEAGIEYYRWHLAHAPTDYQDGTGHPGPYVHNYYDKDGNLLGTFTLEITPPPLGSSVVTIKSTGRVAADSTIEKVIEAKLAKPSFAKYAWVINSEFVRFGSTAEVFGPIHSNVGIRFDGLAHNLVTSAVESFDDPDHSGGNEFGVHTHKSPVDPLPPAPVPPRPDVFEAGRQFPVPAVDFVGITVNLAQIKSNAQANGFYASSSGALGYDVFLKSNDTFDLYRVTNLVSLSGCYAETWSIKTEVLIGNYPIPTSGLMFFEDNIWVRGQINTARLIIASGRFPDNPSTRSNIIINNDILYSNYDGQDVIGLIAQKDIIIGLVSEDDLRVDAAMIAQNGRLIRNSYPWSACKTSKRTLFTSYGMIGTNLRSGLYYSDSNGYLSRRYIYDSNLLYGPPPSFPLTSDQYETISWKELK